jgi:hypothetical protein
MRPVRPVGQAVQTISLITAKPHMNRLARHPVALGHLHHRRPSQNFHYGPIPLLDLLNSRIHGSVKHQAINSVGTGPASSRSAAMTPRNFPVTWAPRPGGATDMAIGANGSVWIIGSTAVNGDYGIYRWNGTRAKAPGADVKVAVDPKGYPLSN